MDVLRIGAVVIATAVTLVAVALVARAAAGMVTTLRRGQPVVDRTDDPVTRWVTMLRETLGHTKMARKPLVGFAHWFVFIGFGALFFTLVTAYGQLYAGVHWALPLVGHFLPYEFLVELIATVMVACILALIVIRQLANPRRAGRSSRFSGSRMGFGYYVEATVLVIGICIMLLRGFEGALQSLNGSPEGHFLFSAPLVGWFGGMPESTLTNAIVLTATVKILVSMLFFLVIASTLTMGVAWHRFTAFPNIWFRRYADGKPALGALPVMRSGGEPIDFEDPKEDDTFGVGAIEEFSWKGLLDFTTCTECGRCQEVCPAWNTGKPLSPKLFVMGLREQLYLEDGSQRPFVAPEADGGVIDPDVLWSCTSCGACVQECPVDIEHVDHIMDVRRHQVLVESEFPGELNQLFRGLESKGNPWNAPSSGRLDWTKGLSFEVPVLGRSLDSLDGVDYLFWVGCAGAYDDRAKKTTQAVAELLHLAGVSYAVLGDAETCTGDPARRSGNEFVYQMLAQQNVETFREVGLGGEPASDGATPSADGSAQDVRTAATEVIVTCAHCFNTIKNEYRQLGLEVRTVHHTQLLNRLVREGKLKPAPPEQDAQPITYHDPCYLGRHNQVYDEPRELLGALPELELREMPRNSDRSFCCGAGGGRMWMEESIGTRVNAARTAEALETGAEKIATGCPFCRVMLSDGVNETSGSDAEVLDVAQLLLAAVRRGQAATDTAS